MRAVRRTRPQAPGGPGPSKAAYRLRRAWAKPWLRRLVLLYLPLGAVALSTGLALSDPDRREALRLAVASGVEAVASRPEFAVAGVEITGAEPVLALRLAAAFEDVTGRSSLLLDLEVLRRRAEADPAVKTAALRLGPEGLLYLSVAQRRPAALWRSEGRLFVLDTEGVAMGLAKARADFPSLPLLLGEGADAALAEAEALLDTVPDLVPRLRALARIGRRRWTLHLDGDLEIHLPESGGATALARLLALHQNGEVLDRDLAAIDLRLPDRPVLRLRERAVETLRVQQASALRAGEEL